MMTFHDFLRDRIEQGGFSTEDALASFLPLARLVTEAHAAGLVAPLDGLSALQVDGVRIWFHDGTRRQPSRRLAELARIDRPRSGAVDVLSERRRLVDAEGRAAGEADLALGSRDEPVTRPVHLPGYRAWEHLVGHHDPVTDVFSLGLILASLACGVDLSDREGLAWFVRNRRNPFRLNPHLHPVIAKAIVRMTEISRHDRPQDLGSLILALEHHRDQAVDLDLENGAEGGGERRPVILGKLRERLFEISRRNRLLHFRSTLGSLDLTQASVPLSFDVRHVRPEQILTWKGELARTLSAGEPISLNRYLAFDEQVYLPSVLDRLRTDAQRDAAEYGFEQLRLAICLLRWANLKETPPEHYTSPLVLLPVRLLKKKGIRDTWVLQPIGTEAEVNPVVRHLFAELHGIELPATLDLARTTLEAFHQDLARRIAASEPAITLGKVERPRVEVIHELAQRRVDRYLRSARLSGRGLRTWLGVDYSYDPGNFHPLGLALFQARVAPRRVPLALVAEASAEGRSWVSAPAGGERQAPERERRFHALCEAEDDNPYHWELDLCRVTLGNFKYRKMTLVRDYHELLHASPASEAFDAVFSLAPRQIAQEGPPPPLEERFHVVPCDSTQAAAIGLARAGTSYVVQGPPGTGKSQTITNLVADYVARGKRVLFVCEKRAAIDVVHARLRQRGLQSLCCLIHDSQVDKKVFIEDLKETYQGLLAERAGSALSWRARREKVVEAIRCELEPLERYDRAMRAAPSSANMPLRTVLERAAELLPDRPPLATAEREALPPYAEWTSAAPTLGALAQALAQLRPDGVLARHPLRLLGPAVLRQERPRELVAAHLADARERLAAFTSALRRSGLSLSGDGTLDQALALVEWASSLDWLARRELLGLLDGRSEPWHRYQLSRREVAAAGRALASARETTRGWTAKLSPAELPAALALATALEGRIGSLFRPAWWRLRRTMRSRYAFSRQERPRRWSQLLLGLAAEYAAAQALADAERAARVRLGVEEPLEEIAERLEMARAAVEALPRALRPLHQEALRAPAGGEAIDMLAGAAASARQLRDILGTVMVDFGTLPLGALEVNLREASEALGELPAALPALELVAGLSPRLASAIRRLPLDLRQLEAAVAGHCADEVLGSDVSLHRFDGTTRDRHLAELEKLAATWQEANAGAVLERARATFLERLRLSSLPPSQLTPAEREVEAAYRCGRRDLEREFGKAARHKSIRDLVAGDSGAVVFDLKPVWLMSPLSVSDTLPLRPDAFDVVIFDEASQIPLESAVPSIFRAPQAIVVGDEMQLPPTDFFSTRVDEHEEDGETLVAEGGRVVEYDLSARSFLDHAAKNLPSRMLGWHYRSRSESLIAFSNSAFYQGRLLTVPESCSSATGRGEIVARLPGEGDDNAERILDRPVAFHLLEGAVYENRRNPVEAAYVAHLVRGLLARPERPSIGIVAFSEAQEGEIEAALAALAREDRTFSERLEGERSREEDGQLVGLLVKNLENVQGDERDVVILSVCYGKAPDGKMRMNFGPINLSGGGRRLNVAFSRAREHMCVVSSIRHGQITNEHNDGASCLRNYLRYAEAASAGDLAGARRVLHDLAVWRDLEERPAGGQDAVGAQIAAALRQRGYDVDTGVGLSRFRCDVAARRRGEEGWRVGILVDGEDHYRQDDVLERDLLRPGLLRASGWQVAHVLASDWYRDRRAVLGRLFRLLERSGPVRSRAG